MIKSFAAALLVWTILLIGGAVQAQDQVPVKIISDKMEYNQENNTVIFTGNVHVDRIEFELWSEKLTVFMLAAPASTAAQPASGPDPSRDIEKLLAEGKVRIKRENQIGTSEKATYWTKKGVIVMEGNPVLKDEKGSIAGEVITYHVQDKRGVVQGGEKQRVQAVFMAPADTAVPQ